jgi:RNA polymerase sigma-70 factor (ECF subfamily)
MAIAYRILRSTDRAEDAVQAAYVSAWRELPGLRDNARFEAWLHRLLVNSCYDEARNARRWAATVPFVAAADSSVADETRLINDRDFLERGLRQLPVDQRAVLVLHHYAGLSVPEVADRLGVAPGTVKSRLHRAREAFQAAVDADARGARHSEEQPA